MATQPNSMPEQTGPQLVPPPKPLVKQRMSLYEVTLEGLQIEDALIASEGELSPELEQRFDSLLAQGPEALDAAAGIVKELGKSEAASKEEKDRQQKREHGFRNNAARLKARMRVALDAAFNGKLKTKRFNMFTVKGRESVSVEFVGPEGTLENLYNAHAEFVKKVETVTYQVNEDAVKATWEAEAPNREAYALAMAHWRELLAAADDDKAAVDEVLVKEPLAPHTRIPEVIQVADVHGDRSLTIR